jgi:hypothetical protein
MGCYGVQPGTPRRAFGEIEIRDDELEGIVNIEEPRDSNCSDTESESDSDRDDGEAD